MKTASLLCVILPILLAASARGADSDRNLRMIDDLFREFDRPDAPGASVMVIRDGKILLARSYGLATLDERNPPGIRATPDSNYRLASVSKQFTAMAVMILAEAGRLSFDDPITKFFPEFPAYGKGITVRHLLNHTSGLLDYEDLIPRGTTIPVLDINALRLVAAQDKTYFPPGTQFRYSNTGFVLLALIVEKVSGLTYATFLRERIFERIGMVHTLAYEAGISTVPNRALGYAEKDGRFELKDQSLTSSVLGDGGIYSSIADLYHWDQALYGSALVSRKMIEQAFTPGPATRHGEGLQYGFGWFISDYRGLRTIWHSGDTVGFTTRIERFPERQFSVIILANRDGARIAALPRRIADMYLFDSH